MGRLAEAIETGEFLVEIGDLAGQVLVQVGSVQPDHGRRDQGFVHFRGAVIGQGRYLRTVGQGRDPFAATLPNRQLDVVRERPPKPFACAISKSRGVRGSTGL